MRAGVAWRREAFAAAAAVLAAATLAAQAVSDSGGWGTAGGSTTVAPYRLAPVKGGQILKSDRRAVCVATSPESEADARIELPDGASLAQLRLWAYDVDPQDGLTADLVEACQAPNVGEPVLAVLGTVTTTGGAGSFYGTAPLAGHTVNNRDCHYSVRVHFAPPNTACAGDALQVRKIQVGWVRQASPAPAAATFNDVPATHSFFQFIEALAKSGITGGCGGGAFCPDQPLTRGQMAVFLAKGLGLAWP